MYQSETSKIRHMLIPYVVHKTGVDLGYGGDSIYPTAINVDLHQPYAKTGSDPQHIRGDATRLKWFADESLDYVYSSHLLEDFPNTEEILTEWLRVLAPGGMLILCLPDEQKYRAYCKANGQGRNMHHSIEDMSLDYMLPILCDLGMDIKLAKEVNDFSFLIVAKKDKEAS